MRRRLSVEERLEELHQACLALIGSQPWDEISMADVAIAAGVSKPLLYHYFATKSELYLATVRWAADQLREATHPDPSLPVPERMWRALNAHLDWIEENAGAYRAILQGGISSEPRVQAIVEESRAQTVNRLADALGLRHLSPTQRIALRGWVGFLEGACLDWLNRRDVPKKQLAQLLATSITAGPVEAASRHQRPRAPRFPPC